MLWRRQCVLYLRAMSLPPRARRARAEDRLFAQSLGFAQDYSRSPGALMIHAAYVGGADASSYFVLLILYSFTLLQVYGRWIMTFQRSEAVRSLLWSEEYK